MNPRYVIARCVKTIAKETPGNNPPRTVAQTSFKLLEPVTFHGKDVRELWAGFSLAPNNAIWRLKQLYEALELHMPETLRWPDNSLNGRHCRLGVIVETYNNKEYLTIKDFTTVNPPVKSNPIEAVNEGLSRLRINASVSAEGKLVINPTSDDDYDVVDQEW